MVNTSQGPDDLIAVSRFDAEGATPLTRFESARAYVSPFFDLRPTDQTAQDAHAFCVSYLVGDLVFEQSSFGPMALSRPPAQRFDPSRENVTLWLILSGSHRGITDETGFVSQAGEAHLLDSSRSLDFVATRRNIAALHIPYTAIGYDPRRDPPHLFLPADNPRAKILMQTVTSAITALATTRQEEAAAVSRGISAMVRDFFQISPHGNPGRYSISDVRSRQAHDWLDDHLDDLSLQADSAGQLLGLSRSTLYRFFKEDGGVAAYLRRRRLQRAYHELAGTQRRVRDVAEHWGFSDPSHFHRAFRAQFGLPPSLVRNRRSTAGGQNPALPGIAPSPVINWLTPN